MEGILFCKEVNDREITRICHITKSQKALHILSCEDGIKAVDFLEKSLYNANDPMRLDGKKDFVNCSIQYPNHWYWNKIKDKDPIFKDWVILLIDPDILLLDTTAYCAFNAATGNGRYIKTGYEAFQALYNDRVRIRNRTHKMLSCCPTDDQAEVLVYKNISRKDIIGVIVKDEDQAEKESIKWYFSLKGSIPKIDIIIAPDLFNGSWSNKVRQGIKPVEYKYMGGEY